MNTPDPTLYNAVIAYIADPEARSEEEIAKELDMSATLFHQSIKLLEKLNNATNVAGVKTTVKGLIQPFALKGSGEVICPEKLPQLYTPSNAPNAGPKNQ